MKKRKPWGIFMWIVVFFILIAVIMGIRYLISRHFGYSYMQVLEIAGVILIAIGGVDLLGDLSIRSNVRDNQTKLTAKWERGLTEDMKLAAIFLFYILWAASNASADLSHSSVSMDIW